MRRISVTIFGQFVFLLGLLSLGYPYEGSPEVKTYNEIPYVSGGFGIGERETLRAVGKEDNLKLSFALQNGEYLGGAKVLIKDGKGKKVLEVESDGPLFFAKLPGGNYTIDATAMGKALEHVAHISSKGQTQLYFTWKQSNEKG